MAKSSFVQSPAKIKVIGMGGAAATPSPAWSEMKSAASNSLP